MTPTSFLDLFAPRRIARAAAAFAMGFGVAQSELDVVGSGIEGIRDRGVLRCGVDTGLPGFASQDANGAWSGFEIDLCRAYAAAFLGDARKARFVPLTTEERFDALLEGRADMLLRNTSWTFARDAQMPVTFAGTYYYDGQGFLAPSDLGVASARELGGARICVQPATTSMLNLNDYAATYELNFETVLVRDTADGVAAYAEGRCDAFTSDISALAGARVSLSDPENHVILPDIISKEPLGPVVASADPRFAEAVRWVLNALVAAEEYGVTAANAAELAASSPSPEIRRLLGAEPLIGEALGLDPAFGRLAIQARGNYGEIFERNLGEQLGLGLRRGLNAQWSNGGLLYAPPFR